MLLVFYVLGFPELYAGEARHFLAVVGIIRVGADDDKSLVLFKLKATQKTVLIPCSQTISDTSYRLLRVTRQGAIVRTDSGAEELLELEERSTASDFAEQSSAAVPSPESAGASEETEAPSEQQIVWPKLQEVKPKPQVEVRVLPEMETSH